MYFCPEQGVCILFSITYTDCTFTKDFSVAIMNWKWDHSKQNLLQSSKGYNCCFKTDLNNKFVNLPFKKSLHLGC